MRRWPAMIRLILPAMLLGLLPAKAVAEQEPASAISPPLPPLPAELVLEGDNLVTLTLNGERIRLEVTAEAFGPPIINPDVAERLWLMRDYRRGWRFGPVLVEGEVASVAADFGAGPVMLPVTWADRAVSDKADGVIGLHYLPHDRVTFVLRLPREGESLLHFPMKRAGGNNARIGTEVPVGKKKLMMIFVPERAENLITAPTANFIATHQEGGFERGSDGLALMHFAVERPTRMMRIARPIELGELLVDRFAVRIEDYGEPDRVGDITADDPRFEKGRIIVSRRKGRGRPDLLTRIGSDQIAHCSALTYDLKGSEIRLSCAPLPPED